MTAGIFDFIEREQTLSGPEFFLESLDDSGGFILILGRKGKAEIINPIQAINIINEVKGSTVEKGGGAVFVEDDRERSEVIFEGEHSLFALPTSTDALQRAIFRMHDFGTAIDD